MAISYIRKYYNSCTIPFIPTLHSQYTVKYCFYPSFFSFFLLIYHIFDSILLRTDAYNTICANYQSWMLSCLCGAVTTIYDSLLRFLATCSCLQGKKRYQNNCLGSRIKAIIEYFGSITLLIFVLLSIIFLIITMIICYYQHIAAYVLFIMFVSEIWSTGQWILWSAPYFLYKYKSDRQYFYEKMQRKSERLSKRGIQV